MYGKIVEYRRYDPIPDAPYANVVAVDDAGTIFDPWTLLPWTPTDEWKLGFTMSAEEWDRQQIALNLERTRESTEPQQESASKQ